jgi:hypothetical protein
MVGENQMRLILVFALAVVCGCTAATWQLHTSLGDRHRVRFYSGGKAVEEWVTTGKPANLKEVDGYVFVDEKTKAVITVMGDVVVENLDQKQVLEEE